MPYVNIPPSTLDSAMARIIGKLKGEFNSKIQKALNNLKNQFTDGCPSTEQIENIKSQLDSIKNLSTSIRDRLERIRKLIQPLRNGSNAILAAVKVIKALPIPGLALTAGVTSTFSDLLHLVKEFGTQLKTSATSIESLLNQTDSLTRVIDQASQLAQRIDTALELCLLGSESGTELPAEYINKIVNGTPEEAIKYINDLNRLLNSKVGTQNLDSISQDLADQANTNTENQGSEFYTGSDGNSYEIKIRQVESDFTKAPRRQAVALSSTGRVVAESQKSFSSSTEVLKQEVKFRLDNLQV